MGKYLLVVPGYPDEKDLYHNVFVHSRVKAYVKNGLNIKVFSVSDIKSNYIFEDVKVKTGNYIDLEDEIKNNNYDKILVHFGWKKIINAILKVNSNAKIVMWVHGVEALGWYRRIFLFNIKKPLDFMKYIVLNIRQLLFMRGLIRNNKLNIKYIFVSEWMKNILEKDTLSKNKIKNYAIIPNVVDTDLFKYQEKDEKQRLNILSIRPYTSKKYANDLSVKAVLELSKETFFDKLSFSFYGKGKLFNKTLEPLRAFNNVLIKEKFLTHEEISKLHRENGIMLIPTRQDAQGVSMCEAMSSGLVPITSNNTAIPEYVNDSVGYLTNNYKEIATSIKDLYNNPKKFIKMSTETSKYINKLCNPNIVIKKEIKIINE